MDKLKIFEIEERLGKISALILNCIVCSENDVEIIDLLLKHGANVNEKNEAGETPLMAAVEGGVVERIEYLISTGADKNLKDNNGRSALDRAEGSTEILNILRK